MNIRVLNIHITITFTRPREKERHEIQPFYRLHYRIMLR